MPKINGKKILPYNAEKIFNVVIDIENYANVLPFVQKIDVLEKTDDKISARVYVGVSQFRFSYDCDIKFESYKSIIISSYTKPFKYLRAAWSFEKLDPENTQVHYKLDSEFKSPLMEATGGYVFAQQLQRSIRAFEAELRKS